MKTIHNKFKNIEGYLVRIERDPEIGAYTLTVGLPNNWIYRETNNIKCDILASNEDGKLIKIKPETDSIVIDDLFRFFDRVIEINESILEKEMEFQREMDKFEEMLKRKKDEFNDELDNLKEISFDDLGKNLDKKSHQKVDTNDVNETNESPKKETLKKSTSKQAPKKKTDEEVNEKK